MDFKKIENIFLLAFVFLNVYLLISYINRAGIQSADSPTETINIIREMRKRDIQIPGDLSEEKQEVYYMQANTNTLIENNMNTLENQAGSINDEGTLYTSILSEEITLEGDPNEEVTAEQIAKLEAFVNSPSILFGDQYAFLRYDSSENRFIFSQMVEKTPVGDGTSEISFLYGQSDGSIISYQQTYAGPMQRQGDPIEIISAREAVEFLFQNNQLSSNAKVSKPILTYHRTLDLEDLSMYGPVWLIPVTESGQSKVFRVNAKDKTLVSEPTDASIIPETDQEKLDYDAEPTEPTESENN
ncbi:two-component system regulatory protein YycI [Marinilactibacillus kalidii]|uniref:two-component system regulatory protein YycI n=1 Tax=Marinilactibacillus kalidii TaxID=2820274 RepID=UPI001ABD9E2F|nr:two-component system regulatory protein YycI [Marinilactibacillus kalidii]